MGGAAHDALTNRPAPRPVELGATSVESVAVMIAWGALGGVRVCRRLGVAASPRTLGSSRNPSVNGLAVSALALAHAEEPAASGWEAPWKEDIMSGGSVSMSGMPTAARPSGSMPRRARRCAFSDSRRAISSSRTSDQSKSCSASAVSECVVDGGSGLPVGFSGLVVMVVAAAVVVGSSVAVAVAVVMVIAGTAALS